MKIYAYVVRITPPDVPNARIATGTVCCNSFQDAVRMALDDEGDSWEIKRSTKEILTITYTKEAGERT